MKKEILTKVHEVPLLSSSASQLLTLMGEPDHDLKSTVRIVECDAALTARVLSVVNSPWFSLLQPTRSIARAVSYLGEMMVLSIALESCTRELLMKPLKGYEGKSGALWEHNLRTAIASREISKWSKEEISPDIAFTGGILHDIGKAVLSEFLKDSAREIVSKIDAGEAADYISAEYELVGTNHCSVGYELASLWNLASPLPEIIRYHHTPGKAEEEVRMHVYAVHLGDIIAMMGGSGTGSDDMMYRLDPRFSDYINISKVDFEKTMLRVEEEFRKTRESIFGGGGTVQ